MRTRDTPRTSEAPGAWSRERLQLALAGAAVVLFVLAAGLAMIVFQFTDGGSQTPTPSVGTEEAAPASDPRDLIAASPMATLDPGAATRPDPATDISPAIRIPGPVLGRGPAGVPVFGHTPEGAVAQLAAINASVLEQMSVPQAREVHSAWVQPGGPSFEEWDLTQNVTAFLRGARQGASKDATTMVEVAPAGGLVKGVDGPDWVLACVLLDVESTIQTSYRMGWASCQRMQWTGERWQIGAGAQPAKAPSAWPGSKAARSAGWLSWTPEQGSRP